MAKLCDHCTRNYGYCRLLRDRANIHDIVADADKSSPGKAGDSESAARRLLSDAMARAKRRGCPYVTND